MEHHVEHCLRARIVREASEAHDRHIAQRAERVRATSRACAAEHRLHRHRRALAHRLEQLGLVAKMPIDRAAGDARSLRNVGERRVRDSPAAEFAFRRVEQCLACRCRFLARPACHPGSRR